MTATLNLGSWRSLDGSARGTYSLPAHHLTTHGVVVGMTGSGKTGFLTVLAEEALAAEVPVLIIDVKGDLPNLLLTFPSFDPGHLKPWAEATRKPGDQRSLNELAAAMSAERQHGLSQWGLDEPALAAFHEKTLVRVVTPGSTAGEPLHLFSSLERNADRWHRDPESARATISTAISLVLRLLGLDADAASSKEHVLLSVLAERRLSAGQPADLPALLGDVMNPPIEEIGALTVQAFIPKKQRESLGAALNTLIASPTFSSWRQGATLDVGAWLSPHQGKTPAVIVSVAHLDDAERALVLSVLFEETLAWMRSLDGVQRLRALIVFDEVYGYLPPYPANPPSKKPLVTMFKQGRSFGVGTVIATQNPMDLDYRSVGNAGLWSVGRLTTDADRARLVEGLSLASQDAQPAEFGRIVQRLNNRWFVVNDTHAQTGPVLVQSRWAMSLLRGPMTRAELQRACALRGLAPKNAMSGG